jgi:carboxypeptidase C (cathepsin A)
MCSDTIKYQISLEGSVWIYRALKEKYKILHYSGTTDGAVPTAGTKKWIANEKFTQTALRRWSVGGVEQGHITEYGTFWFATVHGTGHMAPQWKRKEVTELVTKFIHGEKIDE